MSGTRWSLDSAPTILQLPEPKVGSALSPLAREAAWVAYRITSADPSTCSTALRTALQAKLTQLVWQSWMPGRVALVTEVRARPDERALDGVDMRVTLALGVFGPTGSTAGDLRGFDAGLHTMFEHLAPVFTVKQVSAHHIVGGSDDVVETILVRPMGVGYQTDYQVVDSYGWLDFDPFPWSDALRLAGSTDGAIRVRATILATEPGPADQREVQRIMDQTRNAQLANSHDRRDAYAGFDQEVIRLNRKMQTPVFVSELAITGNRPLNEAEFRGITAAFIRQDDLHQNRGRERPWPIASGDVGFIVNEPGHIQALAQGLPVHGGFNPRTLADLVPIDEVPIGLPWPLESRLPGIPARPNTPGPELRVADEWFSPPSRIGTADGVPVTLSDHLRRGHVAIVGASGTGKSTVLANLIRDDLDAHRQFLAIDGGGDLTTSVRQVARSLGRHVVIIDPSSARSSHLSFAKRLGPAGKNRSRVERAAALSADAVAALTPSPIGDDPRFRSLCFAAFELHGVTDSSVEELATLLTDPGALRQTICGIGLSARSHRRLTSLFDEPALVPEPAGVDEPTSVGESPADRPYLATLVAVLDQVGAGTRNPALGRPANALNFDNLVRHGSPVVIDVSRLSIGERTLTSHIAIAHLLDALVRREPWRPTFHLYLDGIDHLAQSPIVEPLRLGRRGNLGVTVAVTDPNSLESDTAAALWATSTWIRLRPTSAAPDTSPVLSPELDPGGLGRHQALVSATPHRRAVRIDLDEPRSTARRIVRTSTTTLDDATAATDAAEVAMIKKHFPGTQLEGSMGTDQASP